MALFALSYKPNLIGMPIFFIGDQVDFFVDLGGERGDCNVNSVIFPFSLEGVRLSEVRLEREELILKGLYLFEVLLPLMVGKPMD
jgi:hypothetical protein